MAGFAMFILTLDFHLDLATAAVPRDVCLP